MADGPRVRYEVYLLQADSDEAWVEERLAKRLKAKESLNPYFLKWEGIPGDSRQQTMKKGLNESECCAVCLGANGLGGLQQMMTEAALARKANVRNRQSKYRVIP